MDPCSGHLCSRTAPEAENRVPEADARLNCFRTRDKLTRAHVMCLFLPQAEGSLKYRLTEESPESTPWELLTELSLLRACPTPAARSARDEGPSARGSWQNYSKRGIM